MKAKIQKFYRRQDRIRAKIRKVSDRLRLTVFKSGKHVYAQIINDVESKTLVAVSTLNKGLRRDKKSNCNINQATKLGQIIGEKAKESGIKQVVFDKGGYKYHGVIKALAEGARKHIDF